MRLGCCVGLEQLEAAADAGYDFAEAPVSALLPERPESAFLPVRDRLLRSPAKPEVWRLHLPEDLKITGPVVDWPRLARYVHTALRRAAAVGGAAVAFCSGPSRQVSKGFPESEALQQLAEFLRVCSTVARGQGMVVGIEPLPPESSNLINSLPEAVSLARRVGVPEVGVLANVSYMVADGQSLLDVVDAAEWLAHVHVGQDLVSWQPPSRRAPPYPGAEAAPEDLAAALRMADYHWRVSLTGEWQDRPEELRTSLQRLKTWFEGENGVL